MQDDLPFHLLEALASKREQVRYIEQATKDEYLVPSELLNDAWHFCERAQRPEVISRLSVEQLAAVEALKFSIKNAPIGLEDRSDLIDDSEWSAIRQQANATLAAFGQPLPDA